MTAEKKRILFVDDEMKMGGVARVLNTLMARLPRELYEIDLLVLHKDGMLLNEVPADVRVYGGSAFFRTVDESLCDLFARRDVAGIFSKLRLLFYMKTGLIKWRIIQERKRVLSTQYDVEVAAKEGFCTIFTAYGDSLRKINWVLTDYSVCNYSHNHMRLVRQALRRIDMNVADSEQALIAYETVFRIYNGVAIPNLMDSERIRSLAGQPLEALPAAGPCVISVARFHPQKGIDRLISASYDALKAGYPHTLYLIGGGTMEAQLMKMVKDLDMTNVHFLGYQTNPYTLMAHCDLFVLASRYEGYATVISESLITGTPVLTTNVSGCREQITDPGYGWIVENSQKGLSSGLIEALKDPTRLQDMKKGLQNYHYPNDEILKKFIDIL